MVAHDELDRQLLREGHSRPSADFFQTRNSTAASPRAWVTSATSASSCCSLVDGRERPAASAVLPASRKHPAATSSNGRSSRSNGQHGLPRDVFPLQGAPDSANPRTFVFDVLAAGGTDLRTHPYRIRRALLLKLLNDAAPPLAVVPMTTPTARPPAHGSQDTWTPATRASSPSASTTATYRSGGPGGRSILSGSRVLRTDT
jgi:hypothetical protein